MTQLNWSQVPKTNKGFVNYRVITSPPIRNIVARAEIIKLHQEIKARRQWHSSRENDSRIRNIYLRLKILENLFPEISVEVTREVAH